METAQFFHKPISCRQVYLPQIKKLLVTNSNLIVFSVFNIHAKYDWAGKMLSADEQYNNFCIKILQADIDSQ